MQNFENQLFFTINGSILPSLRLTIKILTQ